MAITLDRANTGRRLRGPAPSRQAIRAWRDATACEPRRLGDGLTLDDVLVGVWEGLRSESATACPVCGGTMTSRHRHGLRPVEGACGDCGTRIS